MRPVFVALTLLTAAAARADAPALFSLEVIGFSPDGRYVAWVEHGVGEGSGYPFATLRIVEVAKNAPALPPTDITLDSGEDTDTEAAATQKARDAATAALTKLHVEKWAPPREIKHDERGEMQDHEGAPIGSLSIKSRKAKAKDRACQEPFRPLLLQATVSFLDDDQPARLAEERKVPKDRPCTTGCALDKIYASGKSALVTVKCGIPGFEGPASRLVAITGTLPYGLDEELPPESPQ